MGSRVSKFSSPVVITSGGWPRSAGSSNKTWGAPHLAAFAICGKTAKYRDSVKLAHAVTITLLLTGSLLFAQEAPSKSPPPAVDTTRSEQTSSSYVATADAGCDANAPELTTTMEIPVESREDFVKYVDVIRPRIRNAWYSLIGDDLWMKKACAVIEFTVRQDGGVSVLKLDTSTGDLQLDRAALGGIISAAPLPFLLQVFKKPELSLRFRFYYNPGEAKRSAEVRPLAGDRMTAPDDEPIARDSGVSPPVVVYSPNPDYVPEVLDHAGSGDKNPQGGKNVVLLTAVVTSKGVIASVRVTNGAGNGFDEKALAAVVMSKFKPASKDGKPVRAEVEMRVRVPE